MSLISDITNTLTGGAQSQEDTDQQNAINALADVSVPTASELDLPALQQYAAAQQMTPAQMQAYLQSSNALANEDVNQTGTAAQEAALSQLANTANQGAAGNATEQAQESQILNNENETLGGEEGAINQAAESQGVPLGLLQAALATTDANQGAQTANQAALSAQSNNYQTALNALANEGTAGNNLQGQQNTQANTVASAQNAMQQFNAANQQAASANNAQFQQAANAANTAANNQVSQANTGLANQQTEYNAAVPETVFGNQFEKATGVAQQNQNASQNATQQGNQNLGVVGAGLGAVSNSLLPGASTGSATNQELAGVPAASGGGDTGLASMAATAFANGGVAGYSGGNDGYCDGGMTMKAGGMIPGKAKVLGDSKVNDTVPIRVSPGEAVVPRTVVQQNPIDVMRLLAGRPASKPMPGEPGPGAMPQPQQQGHDPRDIAALLAAMKHMRGGGR